VWSHKKACDQLDEAITATWRLDGEANFTENVPVLQADGGMISQEVERTCHVDIALRWGTGYDTVVKSPTRRPFKIADKGVPVTTLFG
jgi:hypothetical protein